MSNPLIANKLSSPKTIVRYVRLGNFWLRLHLDVPLFLGLLLLISLGLFILYSAGNENISLLLKQVTHLSIALLLMFLFAQIPPNKYQYWVPWIFFSGVILLFAVLLIGVIGKGAQRWLNMGMIHFQPSEMCKLATPMMLAWYLSNKRLPPNMKDLIISGVLLIIPTVLIAKQPDLGTALIIACSGIFVILLAGIRWRIVFSLSLLVIAGLPILWHFMHDYQKQRVLTFLNPERDPLSKGYHIIQSKIAIGSGGIFGKGYLNGTQSHLHFLPEHATDFIFAVVGEELGLIGCTALIVIYLYIIARCIYISTQAQDTFTRLLAGSISLSFFISAFVNIGMVSGVLPVVGLPLPLVSYGGTAVVSTMIGFGILMSIHTHRKLLSS